jgi:hypothetical protein
VQDLLHLGLERAGLFVHGAGCEMLMRALMRSPQRAMPAEKPAS